MEACLPPTRCCTGFHFFPGDHRFRLPTLISNEYARVPYDKHVVGRAGTTHQFLFFSAFIIQDEYPPTMLAGRGHAMP